MILTATINEVKRRILFDNPQAVVAVKGDYEVNGIAFAFPAIYEDDFDLSTAVKTVYYKATDGIIYNHVVTATDTDTGYPLWVFKDEINKGAYGDVEFALVCDKVEGGNIVKRWVSMITAFRVQKSIEIDESEQEENEQTYSERLAYLMTQMANMQATVSGLASGAPTAVSLASGMTDTNKLYVYTGSESGYTAGHWYYYNGSAWADGGQYGGTSVDTTLTVSGAAADAKVTGDKIAEIKEDLTTLSDLNSTLIIRSLYRANKSGGGVDFTYVPEDGSFNVKTETVVTNKNNAWKNLLNSTDSLVGMIPGEKYFCEIEKTGEGAETVFVWYQCYQNGVLFGNPRRIYNSNFLVIDEGATGILVRLSVSTNNIALNSNIKVRLERYMSNRALQYNVNNISNTLSQIQPALNILTLGDSIAYGGRNGLKGFVGDLGMPYINIAVTGATISTVRTTHKNIFTQLLDYHTENPSYNPDCIVADGGINDFISSAPMGDIPTRPAMNDTDAEALDKSTLMGATGYLFYQMIKLYPRAQRFFVIIHKIYRPEYNVYYPTTPRPGITYTQEDMHDAFIKICGVYGVRVIDVYKDSMLNTAFSQYVSPTAYSTDPTVTDLYFTDTDGVHPLALGYKEAYIPLVKLALMGATKK